MTSADKRSTRNGATRWRSRSCLVLSVGLLGAILVCYVGQFDACAAITVFPVCVWLVPGILLPALARPSKRRTRGLVAGLWLLGVLFVADAPLTLVRQFTQAPPETRRHTERAVVRVITLNCASEVGAMAEVEAFDPDILLLQESPGRQAVHRMARRLYGAEAGVLWGVDASIVARGKITPWKIPEKGAGDFVHARIRLNSGRTLEVVSLRLSPSPVRLDLWNPQCWQRYTHDRQTRRSELTRIIRHLKSTASEAPRIIGGDFNAPPGDAIFRLLQPQHRDAFSHAGVGWGNTVLNEWPFLRIDQIWSSRHLSPVTAFAHRTEHSDHRMVIADFEWREQ